MKMLRPVLEWLVLSAAFLVMVPFSRMIVGDTDVSVLSDYKVKEVVFAVLGESLRALFVIALFHMLPPKTNMITAFTFGLISTGMVASMWLLVGYGSFNLSDPVRFLMTDSLIFLFQAAITGPILFFFQSLTDGHTLDKN